MKEVAIQMNSATALSLCCCRIKLLGYSVSVGIGSLEQFLPFSGEKTIKKNHRHWKQFDRVSLFFLMKEKKTGELPGDRRAWTGSLSD